MVGSNHESNFSLENYEEFYEDHHFQPFSEDEALYVNEYIPRYGWAYDFVDELVSEMKPGQEPLRILDLGCLDGSIDLTLCNAFGEFVETTGVDLTKDGIAIARERAEKHGFNASFNQGKIEDWLDYFIKQGMTFDVIIMFEVIEHLKDVRAVMEQLDLVQADGGHILISTPDFEAPTYGQDDEQNKCHIRLYTTEDNDYDAINKYGNWRTATSMPKEIGKGDAAEGHKRIKEMEVVSELINVRYC